MDTSHEMILLLWVMMTAICLLPSIAGEIRCYCNDASCVRTGYMCKSAMGRCFSQLTYERDSTRSVHGCAENLPLQYRGLCEGSGNIAEAKTGERVQWPILLCCKNDMCNYMDNLDINIYVTKSNGSKDTAWSNSVGAGGPKEGDSVLGPGGEPPYPVDKVTQRDLWFKAAVIAVPIAGGFILVLLVLLAVRVLKNDNQRHRQLMQMRHHRSLAKAQLYVADHFYHNELLESEKCSSNTHYNNCNNHNNGKLKCQSSSSSSSSSTSSSTSSSSNSSPIPGTSIHSNSNGGGSHVSAKPANVYRDVHIKIDNSKHRYEKIRPVSDSSTLEGTCNSVILWGDPGKSAASV